MKSQFVSKTLGFNILATIVAVAAVILPTYGYTGEVPAEWTVFLVPIVTVVNLILRRFFTNTGLS